MPPSPAPLLSVVTVSRDAEATIADTIASVAMQRRDFEMEHICVDGNSRDSTRSIIDRWADEYPNLKRIYEPDRGIFDAMNKGLRAASGEYVLFLNADDFLAGPDILAKTLDGIQPDTSKNPDLILGNAAMGKLQSRGLWRHRRAPRCLARYRNTGLHPVHQAQITKRKLLVDVGGFDALLRLAADTNQYYDIEHKFAPTIRFVPTDVVFMRSGGSANASLGAMYLGSLEVFRHLRPERGILRAFSMVLVKTMQALLEVRYGECAHRRWFMRE